MKIPYLHQILQLWSVDAGMQVQELQLLRQDGEFLRVFLRLLQRSEHCGADDEVQHHQEEDGRHGFPPHDCGPSVALILRCVQNHGLCWEGQARLGVVGCSLWVQEVRCSHCEDGGGECQSDHLYTQNWDILPTSSAVEQLRDDSREHPSQRLDEFTHLLWSTICHNLFSKQLETDGIT